MGDGVGYVGSPHICKWIGRVQVDRYQSPLLRTFKAKSRIDGSAFQAKSFANS